jgi:hypothetical protein
MRTIAVALLAVLAVYVLPGSASAQQSQNPGVCPRGQIWNEWDQWCERLRSPDPLGPQPGWISGLPNYEPTVCNNKSGGGYHHCSASLGLPRKK